MFVSYSLFALLLVGTLAVLIVVGYVKQRRNPPVPIPDDGSPVLHSWATRMEEDLPAETRSSSRWQTAKEKTATCGWDPEEETARLASITTWMWESVLCLCQEGAEQRGYGDIWRRMCDHQTKEIARTTSAQMRASTFYNTKAAAAAAFTATLALEAENQAAAAKAAAAVPRDAILAASRFHPDF